MRKKIISGAEFDSGNTKTRSRKRTKKGSTTLHLGVSILTVTCQNCFPIRGLKKTFFPRNLAAFPTYSTFFSDIKKVQYRTRNVQHDPGGPTFPVEYSLHVVLDALLPGQASPSYRNSSNYWKKIRKMWREEEWGKGEVVGGGGGRGWGRGEAKIT